MDHIQEGHVVEEFYIGNTRVMICDDYCRDKTPEDIKATLKRVAAVTLGPLQRVYGTQEKADAAAAAEWKNPYAFENISEKVRWVKRYGE